jgi:hypothetical protein
MKANYWKILFAATLLWWSAGADLEARIKNDEASAEFLAQKIAESSGGTPAQYMSYARKLARTLNKFDDVKQRKIIKGPLPGDGGDDGNNGHGNDDDGHDDSNPGHGN